MQDFRLFMVSTVQAATSSLRSENYKIMAAGCQGRETHLGSSGVLFWVPRVRIIVLQGYIGVALFKGNYYIPCASTMDANTRVAAKFMSTT